jgi:peptidoglycan/xylan/chitin deacetylase (PgdA/CDA1 family)
MPSTPLRRLGLKVDCDTYEGTKKGIPQLLDLFHEFGIKASFFLTLGPDTTGRAVKRVFTQKGFLKKMFRSNAAALYGPKTMLYGTLLPSPMIGEKLAEVILSIEKAGHEAGVHGWDHIRWHDQLDKMSAASIEKDYGSAHKEFEKIFGHKARASAAPGWHITPTALAVQEKYNLLYASNTRGGSPFFPEAEGRRFNTLEIPSTLPTWDEMLGDPRFKDEKEFLEFYRTAIKGTEIHSIHTEVEGTAKIHLFRKQLEAWLRSGVQFVTLEDLAKELLDNPLSLPFKAISRVTIPNRGGFVSAQLG